MRIGLGERISQTARFELSRTEPTGTQVIHILPAWERKTSRGTEYETDLPMWFSNELNNLGVKVDSHVNVSYNGDGIFIAVALYLDPNAPSEATSFCITQEILQELGNRGMSLGLRRITNQRLQLPEKVDLY